MAGKTKTKLVWHDKEFIRQFEEQVKERLKKAAIVVQAAAKRNVYGPSGLKAGTGALRRSIQWELGKRGIFKKRFVARIGSNLKYARIHETGKPVIRPKKGKYLAIPLTRKARGFSSPLYMPDLEFIPLRGRNPILVTKDANDEIKEVHWVLVKKVTIPPRPYLRPALDNNRKKLAGILGKKMKFRGPHST